MDTTRALVLDTDKPAFHRAREEFAGVEYVDLVPGGEPSPGTVPVTGFTPDDATLDVIDRVMATTPFEWVVATSESNVAFAAFLRSRYGLPGMGYDQALPVTNKWRMKQWFGRILPVAEAWLSGDFLAGASAGAGRAYPPEVVVKPLSGSSCVGVRRMPTPAALEFLAGQPELFLIERAVDVDGELHCNGVVRDGELLAFLPSAYDRPVLAAAGDNLAHVDLPRHDPRRRPAYELTDRAVRALCAAGVRDFVFHLELLHCADGYLFGEIGLRPLGGGFAECYRRFHGVDLWTEFVGLQLGRPSELVAGGVPEYPEYTGVIGISAAEAPDRRTPSDADLLAVPGVVALCDGSSRARAQARTGSSAAFHRLVLFNCGSEPEARRTISGINELTHV